MILQIIFTITKQSVQQKSQLNDKKLQNSVQKSGFSKNFAIHWDDFVKYEHFLKKKSYNTAKLYNKKLWFKNIKCILYQNV